MGQMQNNNNWLTVTDDDGTSLDIMFHQNNKLTVIVWVALVQRKEYKDMITSHADEFMNCN